jgi:photosystem II stability/assembly factor-like uncharacterized protein
MRMAKLLIGTTAGLLEAPLDATASPAPLCLGEGAGEVIRCPIVVDANNPGRLYAATLRSGVWRSNDQGRTWAAVNQGLVYQEVWSLEQHPVTGELYAGTGPAEIFRSASGGAGWEEIDTLRTLPVRSDWSLHIAPFFARVRGIALAVHDTDVIFGAIEEGWLVRTLDGGKTWDNLRNGIGLDCHVVSLVPESPDRVLAATFQGMLTSSDAGDSFSRCEDFDASYVTQLTVHPRQPDVVYGAGTPSPPGKWQAPQGADTRMFRSEDGGRTWARITRGLPPRMNGGPRAAAVDPADPDVYLLGLTDGSVWMTADGGKSCERLFGDLPGWVTSLTVVPQP